MITQSVEWADDKRKVEFSARDDVYLVTVYIKEQHDWTVSHIFQSSVRSDALRRYNEQVIAWKRYLNREPSVITTINV